MRHQILDYVGTTACSRLYRARRVANDALVILKQLDPGSTDRGRFTRFRNEYALLQSLDSGLTMVLDDFTGEPLESRLDNGVGMELPICLRIATGLRKCWRACMRPASSTRIFAPEFPSRAATPR